MNRRIFAQTALLSVLSGCVHIGKTNEMTKKPIIIAHRGASGHRPEHTLEAYKLAIEQGCDFIEPDLVMTKDNILICRHENNITETTNVADFSEFADRRTKKVIDGETHIGWFTEDFTFAEIKQLRAKERLPNLRPQNVKYDGMFEIPSFEEVLKLRASQSLAIGREIGIYPETKHPTYFEKQGLHFDEVLLKLLNDFDLKNENSPVFIQSFEVLNLKRLRTKTRMRLIQLMSVDGGPADVSLTYKEMATKVGLKEIAKYANGIGPEKTFILPRGDNNMSVSASDMIKNAHDAGLLVHPWTFRAENNFLPLEFKNGNDPGQYGDLIGEIRTFLTLGVDGLFCDFPDVAFKAMK